MKILVSLSTVFLLLNEFLLNITQNTNYISSNYALMERATSRIIACRISEFHSCNLHNLQIQNCIISCHGSISWPRIMRCLSIPNYMSFLEIYLREVEDKVSVIRALSSILRVRANNLLKWFSQVIGIV